jgi:hypothetical protein
MKIGRGNRSTRRKPVPAPLCPPQIPLDHTGARTRAAEVGSLRLTACAMARPSAVCYVEPELMKLTTHRKLVPRSGKCESINPLPRTSSWRSAFRRSKHSQHFYCSPLVLPVLFGDINIRGSAMLIGTYPISVTMRIQRSLLFYV